MERAYRKKPVVIQAVQWDGKNIAEIFEFMYPQKPQYVGKEFSNADDLIAIDTLEGRHVANRGDWIIKGVRGEFYPCKPEIFAETYEPASVGVAPVVRSADYDLVASEVERELAERFGITVERSGDGSIRRLVVTHSVELGTINDRLFAAIVEYKRATYK